MLHLLNISHRPCVGGMPWIHHSFLIPSNHVGIIIPTIQQEQVIYDYHYISNRMLNLSHSKLSMKRPQWESPQSSSFRPFISIYSF